ncbi:zinc finger protein 84-like [Macrobrachium nipponense]|uniref:zinc finger protein 84-like n=1 Tax=Macrobrachium nipponense TaxID=159736 RepID=UPI0030C81777
MERPVEMSLIKEEKKSLDEDLTENADEGALFEDRFLEVILEDKAEPVDGSPSCEDENGKKICIAEENRHMGIAHTEEKTYTCSICQGSFSQQSQLKTHMRTHIGEKPYTCPLCQRSFSCQSDLKIHMRTHTGEKPYTCSICQRSFSYQSHFTKHMRTHTGEKPYTCSVCQKSFSQKNHLKTHTRTHTGEKPFTCSVCQRSFSESSDLKRHMRTHTGEKPYTCSVCQKSFSHQSDLKSHMRTHTGEKPYTCSVCQRSFTHRNGLKTHKTTHTGEKPYTCSLCQRSFSRQSHLKTHMKTHAGKKPYKSEGKITLQETNIARNQETCADICSNSFEISREKETQENDTCITKTSRDSYELEAKDKKRPLESTPPKTKKPTIIREVSVKAKTKDPKKVVRPENDKNIPLSPKVIVEAMDGNTQSNKEIVEENTIDKNDYVKGEEIIPSPVIGALKVNEKRRTHKNTCRYLSDVFDTFYGKHHPLHLLRVLIIVLFGIANANYEFIYAEAGANGRASDGGVQSNSKFFEQLENDDITFPDPEDLPVGNYGKMPYVMVGDDAFALSENLMKPFMNRQLYFQGADIENIDTATVQEGSWRSDPQQLVPLQPTQKRNSTTCAKQDRMAIVSILPLVLAASLAFLANGVSATGVDESVCNVAKCFRAPCPSNAFPRAIEEVPGCRNFCDKPGQPGGYFCCDEDRDPDPALPVSSPPPVAMSPILSPPPAPLTPLPAFHVVFPNAIASLKSRFEKKFDVPASAVTEMEHPVEMLLIKEEMENSEEDLTENTDEGSLFGDALEVKVEPEFFDHGEYDPNCSSPSIKYEDSSPSCDDESGKKICISEEIRHLSRTEVFSKRSNTAGKQITCAECQKTFSRMCNLKSHMRTHTGEKPYSCSTCQRRFSQKIHLKRHMSNHTGEKPFTCTICQRSLSCQSDLKIHMRIHPGEKPYTCFICQRGFSYQSRLTKHMRTHTGEKPYICSICQKSFSQKNNLKTHMRTHTGEEPFTCSVCQRSYRNSSNFKRHIRTHTGEKPFTCSVCQRRFSGSSALKRHMKTHTGEKPFTCSVCQRRFPKASDLKPHMRTHTGEKPYICSICQKSFSVSSHLKRHMRTHTGEKPFTCSVCQRSFSQSGVLKTHMRTHTHTFTCSVCQRGFSRSSNFENHMRTHTGEKPFI